MIKVKKKKTRPWKKLRRMLIYLLTFLMIFSLVFTDSYSSQALANPGDEVEEGSEVLEESKLENEVLLPVLNPESPEAVTTDNSIKEETEEIAVDSGVEEETENQGENDGLIAESPEENSPAEEETVEESSKEIPEKNGGKKAEENETATEEQQLTNPVEDGNIIVGKELDTEAGGELNTEAFPDREYIFVLHSKTNKDFLGVPMINIPYSIHDKDGNPLKDSLGKELKGVTSEIGGFNLRAGQYAKFSNMRDSIDYFVTEMNINPHIYSEVKVTINDGSPEIKSCNPALGIVKSDLFALTKPLKKVEVIFTNVIDKDNHMSLEIIKKLKTNTQEEAKTAEYAYSNNSFEILVILGIGPYRGGAYSLYKTTDQGETWTAVDGNHKTNDKGILTLKPNEKAVISGIKRGSFFMIKEVGGEDFERFTPIYEIAGAKNTSTMNEAEGSLDTDSDLTKINKVTVTINNKPCATTSLSIKKIDSVTGLRLGGAAFNVYGDEALTKELIRVVSENGKSIIISGLMIGETYYMKEVKGPEGYLADNRVYKIEISSKDRRIITPGEVNNGKWTASDSKMDMDCNQEYTIENHRLSSIKLIKKDNKGGYLAGVTFRLEKLKDDGIVEGSYVDKITDTSGIVEFNELLPGRYRITEIATVPGYTLLREPIEVLLPWSTREAPAQEAAILPYAQITNRGQTTYYYDKVEYIIFNSPNFTVPATGGSNYYYGGLGGLLLMALALGGLFYRKKALIRAK